MDVDQVMVTNGSLQVLDFVGWALVEPGDTVYVEAPTYDRAITLFRRHRANVVGIPLHADGPDIEALEASLRRQPPKLFYVIVDFQNPSGATASLQKRRRLADLAEQHGFWLLEDAPYRPLRYRGEALPSLYELAPQRTLQLSSFTKQISPGVRVGYVVGDAAVLRRLAKVAEDTYITPNLIGQGIVYEFCRRGWLDPQLERLRALYGPRLEAVCEALRQELPQAEWVEPDGGFFVSVTLPAGVTSAALRQAASERGLVLSDGRGFFPTPAEGERFVRLPFCALTPEQLREGVRRLADALRAVTA
ncbi:MAG: PLP-dependent aminotransferase family protein [Ardenticatenia bacterium]|nr:PLP-dependent aminotransferase family protein [Ardenticatenia bacterium]